MAQGSGNRYKLLELLATGGMGEIWLARQQGAGGFDRLVVVKKVLPHLTRNKAFLQMFLDEARLAARLAHPNIVQIHDLARSKDGGYFISMEFVHGEDLSEVMQAIYDRKHPGMPLVYAVKIVSSVCEALRYAHTRADNNGKPLNIIHRDVSPANILVSYQGQVKVVDFGIAKAASNQNVTNVATVKGKRGYMSPEQASASPVDHRADIFSLGVILWELLTGKRLYHHDSELATAQAICTHPTDPPSSVRKNIPRLLDDITMRALAKEPADRYQDCQQIHIALERFLQARQAVVTPSHISKYMQSLLPQRVKQWQEMLSKYGAEAPEFPWQGEPTDPFGAVTSPDLVMPGEEDETRRVAISPELLGELADTEETRRVKVSPELLASLATSTTDEDIPSPAEEMIPVEPSPGFGRERTPVTPDLKIEPAPPASVSPSPDAAEYIPTDRSPAPSRPETSPPASPPEDPVERPRASSTPEPSQSIFVDDSVGVPAEPPAPAPTRPLPTPPPTSSLADLPEDGTEPDIFAEEEEEDVFLGDAPLVPIEDLLAEGEVTATGPAPSEEHQTEPYAEILCMSQGVVLGSTSLRFPFSYQPRRKLRLARMGKSALTLRVPKGATGQILRAGMMASGPEALPGSGTKVRLGLGDRAELRHDNCTYRLRVKQSPLVPREGRHPLAVKLWVGCIAGAIALHAMLFLGLVIGETVFKIALPVADLEISEQFAEVRIPPPPPPPPPPPKQIVERPRPPRPDPAEAPPQIPERLQQRIQRRLQPRQEGQSSAEQLAQALTSPVAGEGATLEEVVSNIDAIAGQGATSLDIHGTIAGLAGDEVRMARGGGGEVGTLGGKEVAASGAGKMKGRAPSGRVRGRVQNVRAMTKVTGRLDREAVARVVERHSGQIQACYERALLQNPTLTGRITFEWQIQPNGRVTNAREQVSTLGNPQVSSCILAIIRRMQFPQPQGGSVTVAYPFMFRSVQS